MLEVIIFIAKSLTKVLMSPFKSDMDIMSTEAKKIFSNEEDKRKYIEAVDSLRKDPATKQTIKLSNHEEITLVS